MGGIADYTGAMVCELPLDRSGRGHLPARGDRQVQVFSFNLLDEHRPFTLRIPLEALASDPADALARRVRRPRPNLGGVSGGLPVCAARAGS